MVAIIEEEITILVLLVMKRDRKFREYKVDESFTICDLKYKLFEIYGFEPSEQRIMVKKGRKYDLVHNDHEKLVNGGRYMVMNHLPLIGGARTRQRYNTRYWQVMRLIQNRIE